MKKRDLSRFYFACFTKFYQGRTYTQPKGCISERSPRGNGVKDNAVQKMGYVHLGVSHSEKRKTSGFRAPLRGKVPFISFSELPLISEKGHYGLSLFQKFSWNPRFQLGTVM